MKEYYEKKIMFLEGLLKRKIAELRRERAANEEAVRYLHTLVRKLGGKAEIKVEELERQQGKLVVSYRKGRRYIKLWIDDEQ